MGQLMTAEESSEYKYDSTIASHTAAYLWPLVLNELQSRISKGRILDLGCGNGAFSKLLSTLGYDVVGIDPSESGIRQAQSSSEKVSFEIGSAYDNLLESHGEFDCVISLEVVEHLYSPKQYAKNIF